MAVTNEEEKSKQIEVSGEQIVDAVNKIPTIEADIKSNASSISRVYADEMMNRAAIEELTTRTSAAETAMSSMTDAIQKNVTDLEEVNSRIDELENSPSGGGGSSEEVEALIGRLESIETALDGHTVKSDVPEGAKFTDTVYDDTAVKADILANTEAINQNKTDNSLLDDKISSLTLGLHTDGLFYIFINNEPVGNGISLPKESGDVYGNIDSENNIVLNGNLADGNYYIKYEMADGSTIDIGELVLSADDVEPSYNNILTSGNYEIQLNKRWSNSAKGYSDCNGMISFLIPILDVLNKTIRFKGFTANATASNSKALWMTINASNERVSALLGTPSSDGEIWVSTYLTNTNGVYSLIVNDTTFGNNSNVTYLAINMAVSSSAIDTLPSGLIMTIDEEIE